MSDTSFRKTFDMMCEGRPAYDTRAQAAPDVTHRHAELGGRWEALPCGYGNHFHVGRVSAAQKRGPKKAKRARRNEYA